ncbi:heterokaryon incompatibility domain-containing protein [Trichoderma sp. SZMC 28014]
MFTYTPLRRDTLEIRLVRILSAGESTCDISLELRHALIDEINFAALSYVWGDVKDPIEISMNGSSCMIGHSLFTALRQLSDNGMQGWLWIDALCIQQSDQEEKTHQVQQMRTIFRQAERVFSWLGPGTPSTDKAMEFASRIGPRALSFGNSLFAFHFPLKKLRNYFNHDKKVCEAEIPPKDDATNRDLAKFICDILFWPDLNNPTPRQGKGGNDLVAGIQTIMSREYWRRIWINQEIALAQEATLMCGTKNVLLDHFEATFSAVDECNRLHRYLNLETRNFAKGLDSNFWANMPVQTRRSYRAGRKIFLKDLLYRRITPSDSPLYVASDPRDLIFGLLGIIANSDALKLRVDYQQTTSEVFTTATRALISIGDEVQNSYHLDHCIPRQGNTGDALPSWVPDWQNIGKVGTRGRPMNYLRVSPIDFDATLGIHNPTLPHNTNDDSLGTIHRAGCRVDIITDILQPYEFRQTNMEEKQEWLSRIMAFFGLGQVTGPGEDCIWRTILSQEYYNEINPSISEEIAMLVRMAMRGHDIDVKLLTLAQGEFVDKLGHPFFERENLVAHVDRFVYATNEIQMLQKKGVRLRHTLFKTLKGMTGLGFFAIKPGDVVTLLWGLKSPIILRPQKDGALDGFTYEGGAYVDQIMHGEFLQTNPTHEIFTIY